LAAAVRDFSERHRRGNSFEDSVQMIHNPLPDWPDFRTGKSSRSSEYGPRTLEFGIEKLYATATGGEYQVQMWDELVGRLDAALLERLESGRPLTTREFKDAVLVTSSVRHPGNGYRGAIRIPIANLADATAALASLVTDLRPTSRGSVDSVFGALMPSGGAQGMVWPASSDGYYFRQTLTGVEAYDEVILRVLKPHLSAMSELEVHSGGRSYWHLDLDGELLVDNGRDPVMERFDGAMKVATVVPPEVELEGLRFDDPAAFVRDSVAAFDKKARERAGRSASDAEVRAARISFATLLWAAGHETPADTAAQRAYIAQWRKHAQGYAAAKPTVQFAGAGVTRT
jgi:hypothetical protein